MSHAILNLLCFVEVFMAKKIFSIFILVIISACSSSSAPATDPAFAPTENLFPTVPTKELIQATPTTFVCVAPEPVQADIDRALGFTGKLFENTGWENSYTVSSDKVAVTWLHENGYLAYLEALIFPCSYEEIDLNNYFSDENWDIILSGYESYTLEIECRNDSGIRLYEFTATSNDVDYEIRYWVVNDTPTRVITLMLVIPFGFEDVMDKYAYSLFPTLEFCE
jgi:hypothetical protein